MAVIDSTTELRQTRRNWWELALRIQKFLLVGTVGLAINVIGLWLLHGTLRLNLVKASPAAILLSMAGTFALNEYWTWRDRSSCNGLLARTSFYFVINSIGMVINWQALLFLHDHQAMNYQLANIVGAAMAAVWNFALNNVLTWRE
jgi:dolichol-phosphate mannosyltransferase